MNKFRKGDDIIVITGKDKSRRGTVSQVLANGKLVIEGINLVKKHQKGNPQGGVAGGIVEKEMPIEASNVALFNAATGKPDRIGYKFVGEGEARKKVRFFKSNQAVLDR